MSDKTEKTTTTDKAPLCHWCDENPRRYYEYRDRDGGYYGTLCKPCEDRRRQAERELETAIENGKADPLWELGMPKSNAHRLWHGGIARAAQVAATDVDQLVEFVGPNISPTTIEGWVEEAREQAGRVDDLTVISGIGSVTADTLRSEGILTYQDLADAEPVDGVKPEWVEAAAELAIVDDVT